MLSFAFSQSLLFIFDFQSAVLPLFLCFSPPINRIHNSGPAHVSENWSTLKRWALLDCSPDQWIVLQNTLYVLWLASGKEKIVHLILHIFPHWNTIQPTKLFELFYHYKLHHKWPEWFQETFRFPYGMASKPINNPILSFPAERIGWHRTTDGSSIAFCHHWK